MYKIEIYCKQVVLIKNMILKQKFNVLILNFYFCKFIMDIQYYIFQKEFIRYSHITWNYYDIILKKLIEKPIEGNRQMDFKISAILF